MSDGIRDAHGFFMCQPKPEDFKHQQSKVSDAYGNDDLGSYINNLPAQEITPITSKPEEGLKYDEGKTDVSLLPSKALTEVAKVLEYGANKYHRENWRKGIKYSRVYSAAMRHMMEWKDGQKHDPETLRSHIAHAACNLLFLLEYELTDKNDEFDDLHERD